MACYQSQLFQDLFPHQKNLGFDLGNVEIKERGLKKNIKNQNFSIRGKDWRASVILFYNWDNHTFYFCEPKKLGKKPTSIHDKRNVSLKKVQLVSYFSTDSLGQMQNELLKIVKPQFVEIIADIQKIASASD